MIYKEYYAELGKLLYAVADIDGAITQKEKKTLQDIIRKELVPAEKNKDEYGTDAAYYAEMEFDFLDEEAADAEAAFESFIFFIEEHHSAFDERMKRTCLHVANELACTYHRMNKKENKLLEKLKEKLGKIVVHGKHK